MIVQNPISISRDFLKSGDIIVTTGRGVVPTLIRTSTAGNFSHAMLYIGDDQIVEAVRPNVRVVSVDAALSHSTLAIVLRHKSMTSDVAAQARDFAGHAIGTPYGTLKAADAVTSWCSFNMRYSTESLFCSELVVRSFQAAGIELLTSESERRLGKAIPTCVTPVELAREADLVYVGHLRAPLPSGAARMPLISHPL